MDVEKKADPVAYTWNGVRTTDGAGWVEHFGAAGKSKRLPPRDLTAGDVSGFTKEQKDLLKSEAGKRLYVPADDKAGGKPKSDTGAKTGDKGGE